MSRGACLGNQLGWGVTPSETCTMGHIHTCTILQLYIADTSYITIPLLYTNSSLFWIICHKSPLSPTLFCVSVDTQRAPGARMYIAIHIRRQFFERRQFPTEVKRKQEKTTARQFCTYLFFSFSYFYSIFFCNFLLIICSLYIFQRKM